MRQGDAPVVCEIGKKEFDVINIMRQRDCDPISFPRRKEIASPVKERTPKGDCDVPPLETPFVSAAVRGPRPPCRVNPQGDGRRKIGSVGGGVPDAPQITAALTAMNVGATLAVARVPPSASDLPFLSYPFSIPASSRTSFRT